MSGNKEPLKSDDFPVSADGKKIKKQDGTSVANTDDPATKRLPSVLIKTKPDGKKTGGRRRPGHRSDVP